MVRTSSEDVNSVPGDHIVHYAPALSMWEKNMLIGGLDRVGGNIGLTGVDNRCLPTNVRTRNHTGQYLFFTARSTEYSVTK